MPQTGPLNVPDEDKKKKKPKPKPKVTVTPAQVREKAKEVSTPATKARREAPHTTPRTRRDAREELITQDLKPYVRRQTEKQVRASYGPGYSDQQIEQAVQTTSTAYMQELSKRAQLLEPGLMRENPSLAADLLVSGIPTAKLRDASAATKETYLQRKSEWQRNQQQQMLGFNPDLMMVESSKDWHELIANVRYQLPEEMQSFATAAWGIDPEQRLDYLLRLLSLKDDPDALMQAIGETGVGEVPGEPTEGQSFWSNLVEGAGKLLMLPIQVPVGALSWATRQLPFGEDIANDVGGAARFLERHAGYGLHAVEGVAAMVVMKDLKYLRGWGDTGEEHTPVSEMMHDITGLDYDEFGGFYDVTDFAGDIMFSEVVLRFGGFAKTVRDTGRWKGEPYYGGEEFVRGGRFGLAPGKPLINSLEKTLAQRRAVAGATAETIAIDLTKKYKRMPPALADELSRTVTRADVERTIASWIDDYALKARQGVEKELGGVRKQLRKKASTELDETIVDIEGRIQDAELAGVDTAPLFDELAEAVGRRASDTNPFSVRQLKAQKLSLEQQLDDFAKREPVFSYPTASIVKPFMQGMYETTPGWTGRMLHYAYKGVGEGGKFDLSKFTNDILPSRLVIHNPAAVDRPYDFMTHNFDVGRKVMNIAKVPVREQDFLLAQLMKVKTRQGFFDWSEDFYRALERGVSRGGRRNTSLLPGFQDEFLQWSGRTYVERITSPVVRTVGEGANKVTELRNSLEDSAGRPHPSRPKHFMGDLPLPDIQRLMDAASTVRYMDHFLRSKPVWGRWYGFSSTTAQWAWFLSFTIPRQFIRAMVLVPRAFVLGYRIQGDQFFRDWIHRYTDPRWAKKKVNYVESGIPAKPTLSERVGEKESVETALGQLWDDENRRFPTKPQITNTRIGDNGPMAARAQAERLVEYSADPFMKKLAAYGPDGFLKWLRDHRDTRLGEWYRTEWQKYRKENFPNLTDEDWIGLQWEELAQAAGLDDSLIDAVASGSWRVGRRVESKPIIDRDNIIYEMGEVRSARSRTENPIEYQQWGERMDVLEDRLPRAEERIRYAESDTIPMKGDVVRLENEIMQRWQENKYQMPEYVITNHPYEAVKPGARLTNLQRAKASTQQLSNHLYHGLRPLSKVDQKFTRGSTYRRVQDNVYQDLVNRGYDAVTALEIARIRASMITKDLHYDLQARSSFDRRTRDLLWFGPVWREQVTTYLYRLPSREFWPVAFPLRLNEAYSVFDGLQQLGVVKWDENTFVNEAGELETEKRLVMEVPWATDFIQKTLNNSEAGFIPLESFNPVTPGTAGILPTISPTAESILDMTARRAPKELRPFFETMANLFTFDANTGHGHGPNYIPTVIRDGMEVMGIHVPFDTLSADQWTEVAQKAELQARQWAMSDLAADGIKPPRWPGDRPLYPTIDEEKGINELEDWYAAKDRFDTAMRAYKLKVDERADFYDDTLGVIHLIGTFTSPGRITGTHYENDVAQAYYAFVDPIYDAFDRGDITEDEKFDRINEYIAKNPESFPYATSMHPKEEETGTTDSSQWMDTDEYTRKAVENAHYWYEWADEAEKAADKAAHLASIPPGELAARERKQLERLLIQEAVVPNLKHVKPEVLDGLGIPDFPGRDKLLSRMNHIYGAAERVDLSTLTDDQQKAHYAQLDADYRDATASYDEAGEAIYDYYTATPADRLQQAGYFGSNASRQVLQHAKEVWNYALSQGSSPKGMAVTTGVMDKKADLYRQVDRLRANNAAFDRELRRAEVTLGQGVGGTTHGKVDLYEWIFFGQPDVDSYYRDLMVKELRG